MAMLGRPSGSTTTIRPSNLSRSNTLPQGCRSQAVLPPEAVANLENSPNILPRRLSLQRVKMATAKFKSHFHAPHGHHLFRSNSGNLLNEKPIDEEQKQKEKDFIACFEWNGPPLSPSEIAENPRNKEVGVASKQLRIDDFELIKTIGTGQYNPEWPEYMYGCVTILTSYRHFRPGMVVMPGRVTEGGSKGLRVENPPQG